MATAVTVVEKAGYKRKTLAVTEKAGYAPELGTPAPTFADLWGLRTEAGEFLTSETGEWLHE